MPYENSLVVISMNGPQLKAVLERAYRNYYYYKYVPGYGGYSYYTTCMIDTNAGNKITYNDLFPACLRSHQELCSFAGNQWKRSRLHRCQQVLQCVDGQLPGSRVVQLQ